MSFQIHSQSQAVDSSFGTTSIAQQGSSSLQPEVNDSASFSSVSSQLSSGPVVRQDKVDKHHAQMINGTYCVDSRAIATAMLDDHFLQ